MSDGVITALAQSAPVGAIVLALLGLWLKRESATNAHHREQRDAWDAERLALRTENAELEKMIDTEMERRRRIEDEFAQYRREHP